MDCSEEMPLGGFLRSFMTLSASSLLLFGCTSRGVQGPVQQETLAIESFDVAITGFDLLSPADRALSLDYNGDDRSDLLLYRPGAGAITVARSNGDGTFTTVFSTPDDGASPPNGIAGFDLLSPADEVLVLDYDGDGRSDLLLYRPGSGAITVAHSEGNGVFTAEYSVPDNGAVPPNGIAGFDLLSPSDRILRIDYDGDDRSDLVLYRPGTGAITVARSKGDGTFTAAYSVPDDGAAPPNGIAGFDLLSPMDRILRWDYNGDDRSDLLLYRPGTGAVTAARSKGNGTFTAVYSVPDDGATPPNGIGGFDLLSPNDRVLAFDFNGNLRDDLFLYRPGSGAVTVVRSRLNGTFVPTYSVPDDGAVPPNGIAGFDFLSPSDLALAFDFNGDRRDDLFLYRPGSGAVTVVRSRPNRTFVPVYSVPDNGAAPPNGIGGFDLLSPNDRALVLDFDGDGREDIFLYRPGGGLAAVARF